MSAELMPRASRTIGHGLPPAPSKVNTSTNSIAVIKLSLRIYRQHRLTHTRRNGVYDLIGETGSYRNCHCFSLTLAEEVVVFQHAGCRDTRRVGECRCTLRPS